MNRIVQNRLKYAIHSALTEKNESDFVFTALLIQRFIFAFLFHAKEKRAEEDDLHSHAMMDFRIVAMGSARTFPSPNLTNPKCS